MTHKIIFDKIEVIRIIFVIVDDNPDSANPKSGDISKDIVNIDILKGINHIWLI